MPKLSVPLRTQAMHFQSFRNRHLVCTVFQPRDAKNADMTLRIESVDEGKRMVFRLSGRIGAQNLDQLREQLHAERKENTLDLEHVTLVDLDGVRFLNQCEERGFELLHCSLYIREWMNRERESQAEA
jgi:hypothetical protein